ncbi:MAG: hypothetical protein PHW04_15990 [Candidatus Wallbacteria bacterium]|nr:hypothetical protein [Candidatus Wallbacteria bacterium]
MKILLTGFKPFVGVEINTSEMLIRDFQQKPLAEEGIEIMAVVIETDYELCERQFAEIFLQFKPDAVLCFGIAGSGREIRLERFALNLDDEQRYDSSGIVRHGRAVVESGPDGYWSTLPIIEFYERLSEENIPVSFSNHAGSYLCNHLFYFSRHLCELTGGISGFIHLPPLKNQFAGNRPGLGMDFQMMRRAAELMILEVAGQNMDQD